MLQMSGCTNTSMLYLLLAEDYSGSVCPKLACSCHNEHPFLADIAMRRVYVVASFVSMCLEMVACRVS